MLFKEKKSMFIVKISEHQLHRVGILETPFGLVLRLIQSQPHIRNYKFTTLLRVYTITIVTR
jgi:hypothetical protein